MFSIKNNAVMFYLANNNRLFHIWNEDQLAVGAGVDIAPRNANTNLAPMFRSEAKRNGARSRRSREASRILKIHCELSVRFMLSGI